MSMLKAVFKKTPHDVMKWCFILFFGGVVLYNVIPKYQIVINDKNEEIRFNQVTGNLEYYKHLSWEKNYKWIGSGEYNDYRYLTQHEKIHKLDEKMKQKAVVELLTWIGGIILGVYGLYRILRMCKQ